MKRNLAEFRLRILALDNYKCRNPHCPATNWTLDAHHIIFRSGERGDETDGNGITLCATCHNYAHGVGNLKDEKGKRVSGREFILGILEHYKGTIYDRWQEPRKILRRKT
jgi:5-methylcytosine-specific restriction endonuclease McrA